MNKQKLYKIILQKERFYQVSIYKNLFGNYILERIYGNTSYSRPTGIVCQEFTVYILAYKEYMKIIKQKIAKGYKARE